jgi:hypothetical protein
VTPEEMAEAGMVDPGGMIRPAEIPSGAHPDEGFR